jgi:hypothetical protein
MGTFPWIVFKTKLNEKFTPHNQILKDGQKLLSLCQSVGLGAMGRYVQTFMSLLSLILMKEEYTQKVAFLHGLQPWIQVPMTYQEMMKIVECMEDDSVHKKVGMLQVSQLMMRVNIGNATHIASGSKRAQKTKWDKNPLKDKGT